MVSFSQPEVLLAACLFSFFAAYITVPFIISNSRRAGIMGKDRNKNGEKLPEMGGIAIVAGTSIGLLAGIALGFNLGIDVQVLLAALSTVVIMGILGIIDDLFALQKAVKAPIPFIAAIPLSAVRAGPSRSIHFPWLGSLDFGQFYPLAMVPLGIGGASNAFNMLAGLNGLEAGMGAIISLAVLAAAFMKGSFEAMVISASLFSACIAFLRFNWYPARLFPGDVGTYTIGATIASAVIIGKLEFFGLVLFAPYFLEFVMKAATKFAGENYGTLKNGVLIPPQKAQSITHLIMKLRPMGERDVVLTMLLLEAGIALIAFLLLMF